MEVPVAMTQEEVACVPVIIPRERIQQQHVEMAGVEEAVSMKQEGIVPGPTIIQQDRISSSSMSRSPWWCPFP